MKIRFLNHSSFILDHGDVSILCDYWNSGTAFDNGWSLLCDAPVDVDVLEGVTHLWFSHEHPDHFSPADLHAIPENVRSNMTVLFQETADKRVVGFCSKLGFRDVQELAPYEWLRLSGELEISCAPQGASWGDVDSWLVARTPDFTLLNINDCEFEDDAEIERVRQHCGPIDFLAAQFSFASKQGDEQDESWIERARAYHTDKLAQSVRVLQPKQVLPFASFVYFSHIENRYLNKGIITVDKAAETIERGGATPVVLFPGDTWSAGTEHDNTGAISAYQARYDWLRTLDDADYAQSYSVSLESLQESCETMLAKMRTSANDSQIRQHIALQHSGVRARQLSGASRMINAATAVLFSRYHKSLIYLEDLEIAVELTLDKGLRQVTTDANACDVRMSSEALAFCCRMPFGGETLQVNGRFQNIRRDGWAYLSRVFFLYRKLDQKVRLPNGIIRSWIWRRLRKQPA